MTLEDFLTNCGRARRTGQPLFAEAEFVAALQADPALQAEARAELARCTKEVTARCFGSALTRTILSDILKQV